MSIYTRLARPLLFRHDAEDMHEAALSLAQRVGGWHLGRRALQNLFGFQHPRLRTRIAGLDFSNPVGLAAGFDKNGRIVVNYGVPSDGADVVAARLHVTPSTVPVGVNLVETNTGRPTDTDTYTYTYTGEIVDEFVAAARIMSGVADYLTLNLNCPNTTGGISPFDDLTLLDELLRAYAGLPTLPPVFLKLTAHRDGARVDGLQATVRDFEFVAGFIFNLPPGKNYDLRTPAVDVTPLPGTLCGAPTRSMMDETLRFWYARLDRKRFHLIGSGGITNAGDAYRKIRLGASMLQLYTGLIYAGPGLVGRINRGLLCLLDRDGLPDIAAAVGIDNN